MITIVPTLTNARPHSNVDGLTLDSTAGNQVASVDASERPRGTIPPEDRSPADLLVKQVLLLCDGQISTDVLEAVTMVFVQVAGTTQEPLATARTFLDELIRIVDETFAPPPFSGLYE